MKKGFWLLVLLVLIAGLFWYLRMGRYREIEGIEIPGGLTLTTSLAELPGSAAQGALVYYKGFTLSFNNQTHQANWVAYELTREEVVHRAAERSDRFRKDTLPNLMTASNSDYTRSGYDRGHLAPAADMGWDQVAMDESFFFSNISPQTPNLNRGIWKKLEDEGRNWAEEMQGVFIVTGPVFDPPSDTIGILPVPSAFYKAFLVYQRNRQQAIAFLFPNSILVPGSPKEYAISVDSLERVIGYDLYDKLPDRIERRIEAESNPSAWSFK